MPVRPLSTKYTYGPVPSRRLGRSLGVDLVPAKTCCFDCVYCQLGPTARTTLQRADYVPVEQVVSEVCARLADGPRPDYVTLGGSGEPTLHLSFGDVAAGIRECSDVPIALLTNGALFHLPEVRAACHAVDLILPSLDAGDEETLRRVNRPHPDLSIEQLVDGLVALRREFQGQIWLEVFIVEAVNSSREQVLAMAEAIGRIGPDRVQINTAVRPPADPGVKAAPPERLEEVRALLGERAEVIVPGRGFEELPEAALRKDELLAVLRRRPCTLRDLADGLGAHPNEVLKYVRALLDEGLIRRRQRRYETYYEAAPEA